MCNLDWIDNIIKIRLDYHNEAILSDITVFIHNSSLSKVGI